jgi:hypothetical protein
MLFIALLIVLMGFAGAVAAFAALTLKPSQMLRNMVL